MSWWEDMPKQSFKERNPGKGAEPESADKKQRKSRSTLFTALAILTVIVLIAVTGWYVIYQLPMQKTIIIVDGEKVSIGYFIRRVMSNPNGDDIFGTMEQLVQELIIKQEAPGYGITVSEEDIDAVLRDLAKGESESITDAEYREWYRQQLNASQLSEKDFRNIVYRGLLTQGMGELLAAQVPSVGEQVHLNVILVGTYDEAVKIQERSNAGEEFASLAREASLDTSTKDNGGDVGWLPPGVLDARFESAITSLEIGKISEPFLNVDPNATQEQQQQLGESYLLFYVSEKSVSLEIQPDHLDVLRAKALDTWLAEQMEVKKIEFRGLNSGRGFDSETNAWIGYQVQRLRKVAQGTTQQEESQGTQP